MLRRLTILVLGVWLAASVSQTIGQDERNGPPFPLFMPSIDRSAGPATIPANVEMLPLPIPPLPSSNTPPVPALPSSNLPPEQALPATTSKDLGTLPPGILPLPSPNPPPSPAPPVLTAPTTPGIPTPPAMGSGSTSTTPTVPAPAVQQADPRPNWSLGDYTTKPFTNTEFNPSGQEMGWYADFEIGIMKPHLDTHLSTPAGFAGPTGGPITLGAAPLDWTGVPEFSVGYRFDQGAGELRLSYRFVDSAGTESLGLDSLGNPAQLHTTLSVHTLDFDYVSQEYLAEAGDISRLFFRDLRAGVGIRGAAAYFDTRASGFPITDTHISSAFGGVGPRMFVELHQDLGRPDFQFYTRLSASGVIGPILQEFDQTSMAGGVSNFAGNDTHNKNIGIGIFQVESGLSWEPQGFGRRFRFTAAYSWERWWNFGRTDSSDAELTLQGVVLRAEYKY
jgi:hypothetical protein